MRLPFPFLLTLLALASGNAQAQLPEVAPGERVWATLSSPEREIAGTVTSVDRDTLTVQIHPETTPLSIPLRSVAVLRESRGFPSRLASAVDTGGRLALTSAFTSGVTELVAGERSSFSVGEAVVFGAITGAVLGGVSGAFCPLERWSRVDLPGRPAISVRPDGALGVVVYLVLGDEHFPQSCGAYSEDQNGS